MKPTRPTNRLKCDWDVCEDTGRRIGAWIDLGPLTILIRVPRRNPTSPGGVLLGWGERILLDTFPRPQQPQRQQPGP